MKEEKYGPYPYDLYMSLKYDGEVQPSENST